MVSYYSNMQQLKAIYIKCQVAVIGSGWLQMSHEL